MLTTNIKRLSKSNPNSNKTQKQEKKNINAKILWQLMVSTILFIFLAISSTEVFTFNKGHA